MGKIVAVTGIFGHFGQVLIPYLEQDPGIEQVIGIDREPPPSDNTGTKLVFHQLDTRNPELVNLLQGVDTLINLAFIVMRLPGDREIDDINIVGTQQVCEAAARQGVRKLVILSSVVAYGMHPDNPVSLTEDSPLRPNPGLYYGRAKAAIERYLDTFEREHPEIIVTRLRPCTVVGPKAPQARMVSLLGRTLITVRGFDPPIQLVHEDDLARAIHLVIQKDAPGIYNVMGDAPKRMQELADLQGGVSSRFLIPWYAP